MADETMAEKLPEQAEQTETDWKAEAEKWKQHARDWEKQSKANKLAADELEKLKSAQMTEQEKEKARADKAEAKLAEMKAEIERTEAAQQIADATGTPLQLLMFCRDADAMDEFAKVYAKETHVGSAPTALGGRRIVRGNDRPASNGELFAEFAEEFFK